MEEAFFEEEIFIVFNRLSGNKALRLDGVHVGFLVSLLGYSQA